MIFYKQICIYVYMCIYIYIYICILYISLWRITCPPPEQTPGNRVKNLEGRPSGSTEKNNIYIYIYTIHMYVTYHVESNAACEISDASQAPRRPNPEQDHEVSRHNLSLSLYTYIYIYIYIKHWYIYIYIGP